MAEKIDYGNVAAGMAMDATGSLINNLNNELQMERTFGYNERAAKNADARTRALFTDLYSPEAKVKQLKKAGLSVGMMYGQGGASGTSSTQGAQGAGAGNQQAAHVDLAKQLELGMMQAQIKALEAGANKDNADADSTRGEEGTIGAAEIAQKLSDVGLKQAQTRYNNVLGDLTEIQADIASATSENVIEQVSQNLRATKWQTNKIIAEVQNIGKDTQLKDAIITNYNTQVENTIADTLLKKSQTKLNEQQALKYAKEIEDIVMQWSLDMAKMQNALEQSEIAKEAAIWGAAINSGGKILSELIEMGGWFIPEVATGRMTKKVIGEKKPNETEILTPKKGGGYTKHRTYD